MLYTSSEYDIDIFAFCCLVLLDLAQIGLEGHQQDRKEERRREMDAHVLLVHGQRGHQHCRENDHRQNGNRGR